MVNMPDNPQDPKQAAFCVPGLLIHNGFGIGDLLEVDIDSVGFVEVRKLVQSALLHDVLLHVLAEPGTALEGVGRQGSPNVHRNVEHLNLPLAPKKNVSNIPLEKLVGTVGVV